MKKQKLFG